MCRQRPLSRILAFDFPQSLIRETPVEDRVPEECRRSAVRVPPATPVEDRGFRLSSESHPSDPCRRSCAAGVPQECRKRPLSRILAFDLHQSLIRATPVEDRVPHECRKSAASDPCRGSWPWSLPSVSSERPLSRIVAGPSVATVGGLWGERPLSRILAFDFHQSLMRATPVEDRVPQECRFEAFP